MIWTSLKIIKQIQAQQKISKYQKLTKTMKSIINWLSTHTGSILLLSFTLLQQRDQYNYRSGPHTRTSLITTTEYQKSTSFVRFLTIHFSHTWHTRSLVKFMCVFFRRTRPIHHSTQVNMTHPFSILHVRECPNTYIRICEIFFCCSISRAHISFFCAYCVCFALI